MTRAMVPPCVFFGWWSSPRELQGVWPVDTVAPFMGLQILSASSVPSPPAPPLATPRSVQWLAVSICLCICSGVSIASQETTISGSLQQALPSIQDSILRFHLTPVRMSKTSILSRGQVMFIYPKPSRKLTSYLAEKETYTHN